MNQASRLDPLAVLIALAAAVEAFTGRYGAAAGLALLWACLQLQGLLMARLPLRVPDWVAFAIPAAAAGLVLLSLA